MLKRYELKPLEGDISEWAVVVIDTDRGFFATVSDRGNYAYLWSDVGVRDFRQFLIGCDADYLFNKLMHGRPDRKVFDGDATKLAIRDRLVEYNESYKERHRGAEWPRLQEEDCNRSNRSFDSVSDFEAWESTTTIEEPWQLACYAPEPQCTAFCTIIFPRFKKMLAEEIDDETRQRQMADELKAELNLSFPLPGTDPTYDKFLADVAEKHRRRGDEDP